MLATGEVVTNFDEWYNLDMFPTLAADLAQAVDAHGNVPLRALHPVTGKAYFLISEECWERLRPLIESSPYSHEEQRFQLEEAGGRAEWDNPAMDAYDHYDELRPKAVP